MTDSFPGERISKRIARAGICSRRDAERLIAAGKVMVNGKTIDTPALNVTENDVVIVDGKQISGAEPTTVWIYHKPVGLVTTHRDPDGRNTVFEHLPDALPRVISVGRLDLNSEGLLLLTNSGALAHHLESPATAWVRKYRVRMHGFPSEDAMRQLKKGIEIDGIHYRGVGVKQEEIQSDGKNVWAVVTLVEGKNREIRRIFEHLGHPVSRLIRTSYGPFQLGTLKSGEVREVTRKALQNAVGKNFNLDP